MARDYIFFMPVVDTNRGAGRLHLCPICGAECWSCWAHAQKHWEAHSQEERDAVFHETAQWHEYEDYLARHEASYSDKGMPLTFWDFLKADKRWEQEYGRAWQQDPPDWKTICELEELLAA